MQLLLLRCPGSALRQSLQKQKEMAELQQLLVDERSSSKFDCQCNEERTWLSGCCWKNVGCLPQLRVTHESGSCGDLFNVTHGVFTVEAFMQGHAP